MIDLIKKKLDSYKVTSPLEEESALKEIVQEIILFALWKADFFEVAAFQGGTSLRILHGNPIWKTLLRPVESLVLILRR